MRLTLNFHVWIYLDSYCFFIFGKMQYRQTNLTDRPAYKVFYRVDIHTSKRTVRWFFDIVFQNHIFNEKWMSEAAMYFVTFGVLLGKNSPHYSLSDKLKDWQTNRMTELLMAWRAYDKLSISIHFLMIKAAFSVFLFVQIAQKIHTEPRSCSTKEHSWGEIFWTVTMLIKM